MKLETFEHVRFTNELRVQILGLKELPLDIKPSDLLTFRDDLVKYLGKILEVATAKSETKDDKHPVAPYLT